MRACAPHALCTVLCAMHRTTSPRLLSPSPESRYRAWLEESAPPGAAPAVSKLVTSPARVCCGCGFECLARRTLVLTALIALTPAVRCPVRSMVQTVPGMLRDFWASMDCAMSPAPGDPSLTVLLFDLQWACSWDRFSALTKHLMSCRDCCDTFGSSLRLQSLHPLIVADKDESDYEVDRRRSDLRPLTADRCLLTSYIIPPTSYLLPLPSHLSPPLLLASGP